MSLLLLGRYICHLLFPPHFEIKTLRPSDFSTITVLSLLLMRCVLTCLCIQPSLRDEPLVTGFRLPAYLLTPPPPGLCLRPQLHHSLHTRTHACTDEHTGAYTHHVSPYAHITGARVHTSMCEHINTCTYKPRRVCTGTGMHMSASHIRARVCPDYPAALSCSQPLWPPWAPPPPASHSCSWARQALGPQLSLLHLGPDRLPGPQGQAASQTLP